MINIFDVDSNEIKRILSLHEESTKKQYLNVLNEVGMNDEGAPPLGITPEASPKQEVKKSPFNGLNYTLQNKQEFKNPIGGETMGANPGTVVTVDQNSKQLNIGKMFRFSCKPIPISQTPIYYKGWDGKNNYTNVGSALTNMLRKRYCKGTELKSNEEILGKQKVEVNKDKTKIVNTGKLTQSVNPQAFATQSTELTKQIQTSLGNTAPTGQITDTDLDQLIAQLK